MTGSLPTLLHFLILWFPFTLTQPHFLKCSFHCIISDHLQRAPFVSCWVPEQGRLCSFPGLSVGLRKNWWINMMERKEPSFLVPWKVYEEVGHNRGLKWNLGIIWGFQLSLFPSFYLAESWRIGCVKMKLTHITEAVQQSVPSLGVFDYVPLIFLFSQCFWCAFNSKFWQRKGLTSAVPNAIFAWLSKNAVICPQA